MRYRWQKLSSVKALAACSLTVILGGVGGVAVAAGGAAAAVDSTRLDHADQDAGNWLTYGRTYSEQRYSPLTRITADNVTHVGLAWFADLDTDRGQEATPNCRTPAWASFGKVLDQSTATAIRAYVIHEANRSGQPLAGSQGTGQ